MVTLRQIFILMAFSFVGNIYATKIVSDEVLQISSDNLVGIQKGSTVKFSGNTIVRFKQYTLYTNRIIINFTHINGSKKIQTAVMPDAITLVDEKNLGDIMIADSARYSRDAKTLKIKGNIRLQKGNNLIILKELILHTGEI
jgi:lipopolysaccharide export system protein LptA